MTTSVMLVPNDTLSEMLLLSPAFNEWKQKPFLKNPVQEHATQHFPFQLFLEKNLFTKIVKNQKKRKDEKLNK